MLGFLLLEAGMGRLEEGPDGWASLSLVASGGWKCRDFPRRATPPLYANAVAPQADASLATTGQLGLTARPCVLLCRPPPDHVARSPVPQTRAVSCVLSGPGCLAQT